VTSRRKRWGLVFVIFLVLRSPVFATSYSTPIERDWVFYTHDYAFGLIQWGPLIVDIGGEAHLISPRRVSIYFGSWSADFEEGKAAPGSAAIAALVAAGALIVWRFKRHRKIARSATGALGSA
jgi:hypothetical protein